MIGHRAFTLEDYFALLRRRWWWILLPVVLGPIAGYEISLRMPPTFQSQTLLEINVPRVSSYFVLPIAPDDLLMARFGDMEQEILSSRQLHPILQQLGYNGNLPVQALRKAIILAPSYSSLDGGDSKQPSGFTITCKFRTPEAAESICSDVAALFMEENSRRQERSATETTSFLSEQLTEAKKKLDAQDARLAAFKARYMNNLPDEVETNLNLLNSATMQLEGITEALNRTKSDKQYDESLLAQQLAAWDAEQGGGTVGPVPIREELAEMQTRLTNLEGQYSSNYPDVVDLKAQIAWLRKKAKQEEAEARAHPKQVEKKNDSQVIEPPLIQQLRNELRLNAEDLREEKQQQQRLEHQIAEYQSRVQLSPEIEEQYSELTRDNLTALGVYNDLLKRLDSSKMAGALEQRQDSLEFSIIQPATLPVKPVSPDPVLYTAAGFGAGLILGLAVVLLVEFRDKSIWNEHDIESCVQLLTLATLPLVERPKRRLEARKDRQTRALLGTSSENGKEHALAKSANRIFETSPYQHAIPRAAERESARGAIPYGTPDINRFVLQYSKRHDWNPDANTILLFDGFNSAFGTEELRTLRTQLELLRRQQRVHSLLITSPLPMEGKTFTALNLSLAIACQSNRRLLLIDGDLRVPQLHRALGAPLTPGLSEYLNGNVDELSIIQRGAQSNLFFIPAGKPASNPSDLLGNGRLKLLVRRMTPAFDWIIFDSPPAVPVSDAQLLADVCDGVLVIFRSGATPFDLAQRACAQFGEKQLLGVVLNRVKSASSYNSYYRKVAVYKKSSG
jgi:polysaccharide chain length determinant protein (PEP-CTERM system associated)